jgi:excisionase family DNA binding protein
MAQSSEGRDSVTVMPNEDELSDLSQIDAFFASMSADEPSIRLLGPHREELRIPASMIRGLREMAHALAGDHAVAVVPLEKMLTTQQAADLLNVSRQYLVRLLDDGRIPSSKTGTHRRVRFDDLIAYKQRRDAERRRELDLLAEMSQEIEPLLD